MSFYANLAARANALISLRGADITIHRDGVKYDEITGEPTGSSSLLATKGLLLNYENKLIDGKSIVQGDRLLVIHDKVRPLESDLIEITGQKWNIISIETKEPAGTPIVYFIQVRG